MEIHYFTLEGYFSNTIFENNRPKTFDVFINARIDVSLHLGVPIGRRNKRIYRALLKKSDCSFGQTVNISSYADEIIGTVSYFEDNLSFDIHALKF